MGTASRYASLYERLVANTVEDEDGCWIWQGMDHKGDPTFTMRNGKPHPERLYAHRVMLELVTGFYFPFDQAGHWRCFKPRCIRPDCLRIETLAENLSTRRGYAPAKGSWIPVLFPTPEKQREDAIEHSLDQPGILSYPHDPIPF